MLNFLVPVVFLLVTIPVVFHDIREYRIPDAIVLPGIVAGFVASLLTGMPVLPVVVGTIGIVAMLLLVWRLSGKKLGIGDIKYSAFVSMCLGPYVALYSLFLGAVFGLLTYGIISIITNVDVRQTPIPFAPCIAAGAATVYIVQLVGVSWLPTL